MFNFDLKNYSKSSNSIYLRQPNIFYFSFLIIFILLLTGLIVVAIDPLPLILTILSGIFLTYREEWLFNGNNGEITYIRGAFFIYKRSCYQFSDIDEIEHSSLVKGKREDNKSEKLPFYLKRYYFLKIYFRNGDGYTVITLPERLKDRIEEVYNLINKK